MTPPNIFFRPILPKFEEIFEIVVGDFERWPMLPVRKTASPPDLAHCAPPPPHTHISDIFLDFDPNNESDSTCRGDVGDPGPEGLIGAKGEPGRDGLPGVSNIISCQLPI